VIVLLYALLACHYDRKTYRLMEGFVVLHLYMEQAYHVCTFLSTCHKRSLMLRLPLKILFIKDPSTLRRSHSIALCSDDAHFGTDHETYFHVPATIV
jgi:hypothetical protein